MRERIKTLTPRQSSFAALWTLTKMQLKEKLDFSYTRSFKKTLFHTIFFAIEFVAVTAICFLLFYAANLLKVFDVNTGRIPSDVLMTVFTVMMALSVLFTTVGLVKSLYLSKDNYVLLTFPTTPSMVFLSKLLVYYVYELRKNFLFLVPFFCAYGLFLGYPVYYYPWVLVFFLLIAAVPVLLSALLSMPALFAYMFLKKVKALQYALTALLFAGVIALVVYFTLQIPDEINFLKTGIPRQAISELTGDLAKALPPFTWLTRLLIGEPYASYTNPNGIHTTRPQLFVLSTLPTAAGLIAAIILLVALCFLLSKPLFYKMASKPFEFAKRTKLEPKENNKTPVFLSAIKKEWLIMLRDNSFLSLTAQLVVIMPLALLFLNGLYAAMAKDSIGVQMTVAFNLLIVLLFCLSANIRLAGAYSKDGFSSYLNKVQPSTYGALLFAKLTVNLVVGLVGIILSTIVYSFYHQPGTVNLILFAITAYAFFVAHLFWCGELDIMNPQYMQYATFSEQSNNPNENKATLLTFLVSFLVTFVAFLLALENMTAAWIKMSVFSILFAAFRIFVYFVKIKVYY